MKKIYMMNSSIDVNRGGLTRVMFERASGLAANGYDVNLLTIDYSERYEEIERELHETNRLSKDVRILNIYEYYRKKIQELILQMNNMLVIKLRVVLMKKDLLFKKPRLRTEKRLDTSIMKVSMLNIKNGIIKMNYLLSIILMKIVQD